MTETVEDWDQKSDYQMVEECIECPFFFFFGGSLSLIEKTTASKAECGEE